MDNLPVPESLQTSVKELFANTIYCHLPDKRKLREFVFRPPANNTRLYCTLIRHDDDQCTNSTNGDSTYVLYLEYLGGLVPILKGKRSSKLKPEFVIFDPEVSQDATTKYSSINPFNAQKEIQFSSDSENEDLFVFPYLTPKTRRRLRCRSAQISRNLSRPNNELISGKRRKSNALIGGEEMPEANKIVLITSNIWGTKFKFLGLSSMLPPFLGSITYRTSLLHLQVCKT